MRTNFDECMNISLLFGRNEVNFCAKLNFSDFSKEFLKPHFLINFNIMNSRTKVQTKIRSKFRATTQNFVGGHSNFQRVL